MRVQASLSVIASVLIWPAVQGFAADEARYSLVHGFTNGEPVYPSELCGSPKSGAVWGVTEGGGKAGGGVLFKFSADGSDYTPVADLALSGRPRRLLQGSDGRMYILVHAWSSTNGVDAVVQVSPDGSTNTVVHAFASADDGREPSDLLQGRDDWLYGSTALGGSAGHPGWGTVFKLRPDGSGYRILRAFSIAPEEGGQVYGLMEGSDGALYGTCAGGGIAPGAYGTLFRLSKEGTGYAKLHNFNGQDGQNPHARLVETEDGRLYGTCSAGGPYDAGTLFAIERDGSAFVILHAFGPLSGAGIGEDGGVPHGRLLEATDGVLYGTTAGGGSWGQGTVFRINRDGSGYRVLRSFQPVIADGSCVDGGILYSGLVEGTDGILFGTATGCATVFGISGTVSPRLRVVALSRSSLKLCWPSSWAGLVVEERDCLSDGTWRELGAASEDDGTNRSVRVEVAGMLRFYRLGSR